MEESNNPMQKPLVELTLQDLLSHLRRIVCEEVKKAAVQRAPLSIAGAGNETEKDISLHPEKYAIGLEGLAKLLHVCPKTAFNYCKSGKYDPAIERIGNKIFVKKNYYCPLNIEVSDNN